MQLLVADGVSSFVQADASTGKQDLAPEFCLAFFDPNCQVFLKKHGQVDGTPGHVFLNYCIN
jgi:hypothetical protein